MQDYCSRYTLSSFSEIGFGVDVKAIEEDINEFAVSFDFVQTFTSRRARKGFLWPVVEYLFPSKEYKHHLDYMNNYVYRIIRERKQEPLKQLQEREDLLSQLLVKQKLGENGAKEDDEELRDFVMNFLIAGRDTTACLLTFSLYEIARHPAVKEKLIDELKRLVKAEGITWDSVKKLSFMKQFLQEVLRLYPPVPIDGFGATEDTVLPGNYFIPKNSAILYNNWTMSRTKEFWGEDAEVFDPAHFDKPPASFTFNAFHGGPRICLGMEMALEEAKIFLCLFLQKFDWKINQHNDDTLKNAILLTFKNGLYLDLQAI
jgi:cytochrome P450